MSETETIVLEPSGSGPAQTMTRTSTTSRRRFCLPIPNMSPTGLRTRTEFDDDEGLVMMLDSGLSGLEPDNKSLNMMDLGSPALRSPVAQLSGGSSSAPMSVSVVTLSTSSLLLSAQEYYLKSLHSFNSFVQNQLTRFLPFLLYLTLAVLAVQAVAVLSLIVIAESQPWGLWFMLLCGSTLGFLFCHTSESEPQILTPPPSPSHSCASIHAHS